MNEKVIIKETAGKINLLVIISALATAVLLVLAFDMLAGGDSNTGMWFMLALAMAAITGIVYWATAGCEIAVTDKRIYGKVAFGKRVDLPLDSVSAVATTSVLTQGVSVSTSSGRITFLYLAKKEEIASKIRELLVERQNKVTASTTIKQEIPQSNADELKKYKELLDSGVITQEEFDAKKKQLLGL